MQHHAVDIQWGNHDILWMGASTGHPACVATVVKRVYLINVWIPWKAVMVSVCVLLLLFATQTYKNCETT